MKKNPILSAVILIAISIWFIYKGIHHYIAIPDTPILGILQIICGLVLIGYSIYILIRKPKEDND